MDPLTWAAIIGGGSSLLGGILGGAGEAQMSEEDRKHQVKMLLAQLGLSNEQFEQTRGDSLAKTGLEYQGKAPERVGWRQNQAIQAAIMPGLRNFSVSAPSGMEQYVPKMSGGFRIPEGGFGPDTLKFFGDNAMLQGEMDLDKQAGIATGGRYSTPSYGSIYGTPQASAGESYVSQANANLKKMDEESALKRKLALTSALGSPTRGATRTGYRS